VKKEIADIWVASLRSGEFKQGRHRLTSQGQQEGEQYDCCLGVLGKLAIRAGVKVRQIECSADDIAQGAASSVGYAWESPLGLAVETIVLSRIVQEWAGMRSDDGALKLDGVGSSLAAENDGEATNDPELPVRGKTFAQIADIIEKYWEEL